MSETDRPDKLEEDVRELSRLKFRLMGFGIGLALLVTLAPTWLTKHRWGETAERQLYSGISFLGLTPDADSPMKALGTLLFVTYLLLALALLLIEPHTGTTVLVGIAGLVVTIVAVANKPDGPRVTTDWTGAPAVALGLWILAIVVSGIALKKTRS